MKKELLLTAAVLAAVTLPAFADSNTNNGAGNVINDNSGIGNGNTSISTNSNNPTLSATGGTSSATGGNASATGGAGGQATANSRNTNLNSNSARQKQGQSQSADNNGNSQGVSMNSPRQAPSPAPTFLAGGNNVISCLGSAGGSITAPIGGIAFGGTTPDRNCQRILLSREIRSHGRQYESASIGLLCRDDELREEMARNGTPCPGFEAADYSIAEEKAKEEDAYPKQTRRF